MGKIKRGEVVRVGQTWRNLRRDLLLEVKKLVGNYAICRTANQQITHVYLPEFETEWYERVNGAAA